MNRGKPYRGKSLRRALLIILTLSRRGMTIRQLADLTNVCNKTTRRDLRAIEDVGIPIYGERCYDDNQESEHVAGQLSTRYRIDSHWVRKWHFDE